MMRYCLLVFVLLSLNAGAQRYKYIDSARVCGIAGYKAQVRSDSNKRLVEITKYVPAIKLDIRYATTNNFMHRVMYRQAKAYARLPVVKALKDIQADLKTRGLGLKIFDAYRPYSVTVAFYETTPDTNFVANPKFGSKHNRGCAIDLTLIDLKTGKELDMPTGFDSFSKKASANYAGSTPQQMANRELLKTIMHAHGFTILPTEWWHYDFDGWRNYQLADIPFRAL
ncbi:M15 family metallopeptidase [Mucilaginibacter sp. OK283]|jgi:D-alanyl-D-alanine dipeptidase|uniref:M15 family metallopeptidase n=1 Tax=Mucilaginibacter sp. OK283 TaxID=1881049 RepID=UPI0008BFA8DC|nr:M15 family metallopeptidase [Mucilaginibacter sp. OK283]SEO15765.1 D-alanyl-D-alanine dipeptidase [Mucilaginibacter sp. OK283]